MNKRKSVIFGILFIVLLISYGQTLRMNFWRDDYTMLYGLQHPWEDSPFGKGYIGNGPYKYALAYSWPVYILSGQGKNPFLFFLVGFLLYGLAGYFLFNFVKELTKNNKIAFFSTLIFVAGNVASEGLYKIIDSWRNSFGVSLTLFMLFLFHRAITRKSIKYYIFSVIIFLATVDIAYIRSYSLVLAVLGLDLLLSSPNFRNKIKWFIARQIPFFLIFIYYYVIANSTSYIPSLVITGRIKALIVEGHFDQITPLFSNIGNLLISDRLQQNILHYLSSNIFVLSATVTIFYFICLYLVRRYSGRNNKLVYLVGFLILALQAFFIWAFQQNNYWFIDIQSFFSSLVAVDTLLISFYIGVLLWKRRKVLSITIFFSLIVIISQVGGYSAQYWDQVIPTIHRYYLYPFIGSTILYATLCYLIYEFISKKKIFGLQKYVAIFPILFVVTFNVALNFTYQFNFIKDISNPSKIFYSTILKDVPSINKGEMFYFDVNANPYYQNQFGEFFSVGAMSNETALAYYYHIEVKDVQIALDFDSLLSLTNSKKISINNIHSFFWGTEGLINTTPNLINRLQSKQVPSTLAKNLSSSLVQTEKNGAGYGQDLVLNTSNLNVDSTTPNLLSFDLSSLLIKPDNFPYYHGAPSNLQLSTKDKISMIGLIRQRQNFIKTAKIKSTSEWLYREIGNIDDSNSDTPWQGDRLWWYYHKSESLIIDLIKNQRINSIIWQNWRSILTPISYSIEVSDNNKDWKIVKTVNDGGSKKDAFWTIDSFLEVNARWIRINFIKTISNDSPAMSEIYVANISNVDLDPNLIENYEQNPFYHVNNESEWKQLSSAVSDIGTIEVSWNSDKEDNINNKAKVKVLLNSFGHYTAIIPAEGTSINKLVFRVYYPSSVRISNLKVENLTYSEIKAMNLIKSVKTNLSSSEQ